MCVDLGKNMFCPAYEFGIKALNLNFFFFFLYGGRFGLKIAKFVLNGWVRCFHDRHERKIHENWLSIKIFFSHWYSVLRGKNSLWPRVKHNRQVWLEKSNQFHCMLYKLMFKIRKRPSSIQRSMMFHHWALRPKALYLQ